MKSILIVLALFSMALFATPALAGGFGNAGFGFAGGNCGYSQAFAQQAFGQNFYGQQQFQFAAQRPYFQQQRFFAPARVRGFGFSPFRRPVVVARQPFVGFGVRRVSPFRFGFGFRF